MRILTKKIIRDIRYNKGRSISIVLIIAIATALYVGLLGSHGNVVNTFELMEEDLNVETVRYTFYNFTDRSSIETALEGLSFSYIEEWDFRISLLSTLQIKGDEVSYTAPLYGVPGDREPLVNNIDISKGTYFSNESDAGALLSKNFMENKGLSINDEIVLLTPFSSTEIEIKASIVSPEYFYNVNPKTGLPDLQGLAPIWLTLDKVQDYYGLSDVVNEVVIRFTEDYRQDPAKLETAKNEIGNLLHPIAGSMSAVEFEEEADQKMKEGDVGVLDDFGRIFGGVVLLVALFAIYDNISKLIANQRNYIGTMRALGGSRRKVALHYASMAIMLGLIGVLLGMPLGYLLGIEMVVFYADLLNLPEFASEVIVKAMIEGFLVIFGLVVSISLLTSIRATYIEPREAMSSSFITVIYNKKPLLERFLNKIPGMKSPSSAMAFRSLFRNRRKTLITIFTFAISLILIIAGFSFINSFDAAMNETFNEYQRYDLEVYFENPLNLADIESILSQIEAIEEYEGFVSIYTEFSTDKKTRSSSILGFEPDSKLRKIKGAEGLLDEGLIMGTILANDLGLGENDQVTFLDQSFTIKNLAHEVLAESAFLPIGDLQTSLGIGANVTGIILTYEENADLNEVKNDLQQLLPVSVIISMSEMRESIEYLIQGLLGFVGILIFLGFIIVALFSFNTIVLEMMSRENEFVNLRSLGAKKRKIAKIILMQSLFITFFGSLIAIPLGWLISDIVLNALMKDLMVMDTVIFPQSYLISIFTAFIASLIGIFAAYRHVNKINLVDALRTRVAN